MDLYTFTLNLQRGKTIADMYSNAEDRQKELIISSIDCVLILSLFYSEHKDEELKTENEKKLFFKEVLSSKRNYGLFALRSLIQVGSITTDEAIRIVNQQCRNYFRIVENGLKKQKRAEFKILSRFDNKPEFLTDITRITIIPSEAKYAENIPVFFKSMYCLCSKSDWSLRPSGVMSKSCHIDLQGFVSQIRIDEEYQSFVNHNLTHRIYETVRKMTCKDHVFGKNFVNQEITLEIMREYNAIMSTYGKINPEYEAVEPLCDIAFFQGDELFKRYKELQTLHQSIHIEAISHASESWQKLYCELCIDLNNRSLMIANEVAIPEYLLERIPIYKNYSANNQTKYLGADNGR